MTERPLIQRIRERYSGRRKTLWPAINNKPIEYYKLSPEDTPIFNVPMMPGETRMINNLEIKVRQMPRSLGIAEVVIRETAQYLPGMQQLLIEDVWARDGVIQIGQSGVISLRKIKNNGRMQFSVAMPKDIDIHSKEHRKKIDLAA